MLAKAGEAEETLIVECDPRVIESRAPQLALPARPPDRRLRADREPGDRLKVTIEKQPARPRLPHARRMGAARGHLDRLAAQPRRLARHASRRSRGSTARSSANSPPWRRVRILVQSAALEKQARRMLEKVGANLDAVEFFQRETDRVWTRDYCPLFVKNRRGEIALTAWRFNAWAKYDDWRSDATDSRVPRQAPETARVHAGDGARRRQHRRQRRRDCC